MLLDLGNDGRLAVIDEADADLAAIPWRSHTKGYAVHSTYGYLHRLIAARLGFDPSKQVDHRDTDRLNNRRSNLRPAEHAQNMRNRNGTSKTGLPKGVWRAPCVRAKYTANIVADGQRIYLGIFETVGEAGWAYDLAALRHFGEFARTNCPYVSHCPAGQAEVERRLKAGKAVGPAYSESPVSIGAAA